MHVHVRIHHWVIWWVGLGAVCGGVALLNILLRDLSRPQERVILIVGVLFWLLGGVACYGYGGVQIVQPHRRAEKDGAHPDQEHLVREPGEWHPASDFVLPGNRKSLLPPKY